MPAKPKTILPILLLAICAFVGCGDGKRSTGGPASTEGDTPANDDAGGEGPLLFTDVSAQSGVVLQNVSGDPVAKMALPENLGQGAAAIDFDNDGLQDLFIANGDVFEGQTPRANPRCALYRNLGGMRFEDVTTQVGLDFKAWCHGAYAVDFDGDGWKDLYVTVFLGPNRFFRNTGQGRFEEVSERWGAQDDGPSTAACFFDADQDGDLDLYVGNYVVYDPKNPPNDGKPCDYKGLAVSCGPRNTPPGRDHFYVNHDGRLQEATQAFGFGVTDSFTLGVVSGDFDNDGDVDLYVANDSLDNYLFENMGKGRFREAGLEYGVSMSEDGTPQAGMGVDFGDVDNDGRFDLFVTNFSQDHNTLYHNVTTANGEATFTDGTARMGLKGASFFFLSWGTRVVDFDHDGWQDLVVVSGHIYPQIDTAPQLGTTYHQYNQLFHNQGESGGGLHFMNVADKAGGFYTKGVSRGLVTSDLDNDGDIDLLVVEMDSAPLLLRNDTKKRGQWVGFECVGAGKLRDPIGTRISVTTKEGNSFHRELSSGGSYLSTRDPRLHFGLGNTQGIAKVSIRWPNGKKSEHDGCGLGSYFRVKPDGSIEQIGK